MSCEQQLGNHHFPVLIFLFSFFNDSRMLSLCKIFWMSEFMFK